MTDISKQMETPADYNTPVKEGSLWKIFPKDKTKPTLYYSTQNKRVVEMTVLVNGAESETEYEYCNNTCKLPATLKKSTITTTFNGSSSKVAIEILRAKKHHTLPKNCLYKVKELAFKPVLFAQGAAPLGGTP